jgi:hypothetical protein
MREPVFNETVQLGIVVRDLEATGMGLYLPKDLSVVGCEPCPRRRGAGRLIHSTT